MSALRFIPNREGQDLQASFSLLHDDASPATPSKAKKRTPHGELHFQKSEQSSAALCKHCAWQSDYWQLRKQTVPSPPFSDPNCSTPPFLNQHHLAYHPILLPHIQRLSTTHQDQERRQQISHLPHSLPILHLRHPTKTFLRTCPLGTIQIYPGTQHRQGHHRVGTGPISTHVQTFTVYLRSALTVKGFSSAREKHLGQSVKSHSKYLMRQISRTTFI